MSSAGLRGSALGRQSEDTAVRIREAASALFAARGFRAVTIDDIAERAGVTKRTVYCHFRSKDDLIASCLDAPDGEPCWPGLLGSSAGPDVETDVRRAFSRIAEACVDMRWTGDAFVRAAIEMAGLPGHPALVGARRQQGGLEDALRRRLDALALSEPEKVARRVLVLLNGAIVHGLIHHDVRHVEEAGRMALEAIASARREEALKFPSRLNDLAGRQSERRGLERRRAMPR